MEEHGAVKNHRSGKVKGMKKRTNILLCIIPLFFLLSCGLEEFYYIDYIDDANIDIITYESTIIRRLPSNTSPGYDTYFDHFNIFYRLYLSNTPYSSVFPDTSHFSVINSTLNSNFSSIYSTTDKTSTSFNSENLENFFYTRDFFKLALYDVAAGKILDADSVLSKSILGGSLEIIFSGNTGDIPMLRISNKEYYLLRADKRSDLTFKTRPKEHRFFLSEEEIRDIAYLNKDDLNNYNADVAKLSSADETYYCYAMMYICAQGITGDMPPRPIFSQPSFLGVFRLPQPN